MAGGVSLIFPSYQTPLTFLAFLTDPDPITHILAHIGESLPPLLIHPARGPPQTDFDMGFAGAESYEAAQESSHVDLDQAGEFDPTDPEPVPEDDSDQSWDA
jgi:hypothetical protein